jgi:hypothetical protein
MTLVFLMLMEWLGCEENGRSDLLKKVVQPSHLTRELNKQVEGFRNLPPYRPGGDSRQLLGIRLRKFGEDVVAVPPNPPNPPIKPSVVDAPKVVPLNLRSTGFRRRI